MPVRISSETSSARMAEVAANRAPEKAHQRVQNTRRGETASPRAEHAKEVRDSFQFSPDAKARAASMMNNRPTTQNAGIDQSVTPQFSERTGVSYGSKG